VGQKALKVRSLLRRTVRIAFFPVFRYFGPRFAGITQRLESLEARAVQETQTISKRLDQLETRVLTDVETTVEVLTIAKRSIALLDRRIADLDDLLSNLPTPSKRSPAQLIEFAFAVHAGLALRPRSRVLLIGPADEELGTCLQAWGHSVVDAGPAGGDGSPDVGGPLEAIFCMSAGESADGGVSGRQILDRLAVKRFAERLAPGGQIVVSVPYGQRANHSFDSSGLEDLLDGYTLLEVRILARDGSGLWTELERKPEDDYWRNATAGLALVRAALSG
jgi:hypothetical protein